MIEEYSIIYKKNESHTEYLYELQEEIKDLNNDFSQVKQIYLKTYDINLNELDCIVYFCNSLNIDKLDEVLK